MLINAHLNGFHWAKSDIGEKFSRGWGDEVERCSVKIRIFLSHRIRVNVLENFVKAEFASSLHGVANQGRGPAASKRLDTTVSDSNLKWSIFLFNNLQVFLIYLHSLAEGRIFGSVDLHAAFDEIEWDDGCVGQSAGKGSSDHAFCVIFGGPELTAKVQN